MTGIDEDFTELTDADIPRVDLVDKAANGMRFLMAKQDASAGLLDAGFVRDLIAKAEPEPQPTTDGMVTVTGTPRAIEAFMRKTGDAAVATSMAMAKAEMSQAEMNDLYDLARTAVAKTVLSGCEYLFDGYAAPVEEPVVVGAEHDHILKAVVPAVFPGHDMADVAGRLVPTAERATVEKILTGHVAEGRNAGVDAPTRTPALHESAVIKAAASIRTVAGGGPDRRVVAELLTANVAGATLTASEIVRRVNLLIRPLAGVVAKNSSGHFGRNAADDIPSTLAASLGFHASSINRDRVVKSQMSEASQNNLPDSAFAYVESGGHKDDEGKTVPRNLRHFPINDAAHVRNALARAPQSPFGDKAMPKIRAAASKFGIEVAKMEPDDSPDAMDPTTPLATPGAEAPGNPADPGSPAWEAVDAATARKWTSIAVRLKNALGVMADRELLEAATADPDDAMAAWDLQDAQCALDYVIDTLAGFAVDEQAEAELAGEAMAAVGKALGGFDTGPLDTIEALAHVAKAGRVLSTANEAAIRGAVESLQKVLASLPQAPATPDDEGGRAVAKQEEQTMPEIASPSAVMAEQGAPAGEGLAKGAGEPDVVTSVAKAPAPQVAVYDKNGRLVGIVDPEKIVPIADAEPEDSGAEPSGDTEPDSADTETTDLEPAPAAEVGTPADAVPDDGTVTKQTHTPTDNSDAVFKSIAADVAKGIVDDYSATQEQALAKQAETMTQLAETVETLKGQIRALEEQPAEPKVFTQGAVPPAHLLRGQDRGAPPVDVAKARELKKGLYGAADATEQNRIATGMQAAAIEALEAIHQRRQ